MELYSAEYNFSKDIIINDKHEGGINHGYFKKIYKVCDLS